jgi:hypothetical protein
MSASRFWEEVHHWFNPSEAVALEQPQLHAERDPDYNPIVKLERELRLTRDPCRYLLTGTVGNGKTSELNFCASRLTAHRIVILVDLWAHVQGNIGDENALDHLEMWELLGLIGVAVVQAGTERFGQKWGKELQHFQTSLARLREAEESGAASEIDVVQLGRGMAVAAGGLVGAAVGGPLGAAVGGLVKTASDATKWTWKVGLPGTRRRGDQDGDVRRLLDAVNALIDGLQSMCHRRLLLVIDGLDRIQLPERTQALFLDSRLLGNLECDQLITVPGMLMRRQSQNIDHFKVRDLYNVPVLRHSAPLDRDNPGKGLPFFRELVRKRVAWITETAASPAPSDALPEPLIDRLAYYSGGVVRDFVKLVRLAALEILDRGVERLDDAIVDAVLREGREDKEYFMTDREIALLEAVIADPDHRLPGDDLALDLLAQRRLLAYPNQTTWYFPHPLLTLALLKPGAGSAA